MNATLLEPRKALNKAFLKIKPNRLDIERFKTNLIAVLDAINEKETEEFHKNLVIDFLKKTYYDPNYFVNTKGRNDLVIYNGKDANSSVGVIVEAKSPSNKAEMIAPKNLNGKALQELVLYYMRERISHKNTDLKQLVVTNIYEWFVFDAQLFNTLFAENKKFVKDFIDFENGSLSSKKTDFFYKEIAKPFIANLQQNIEFAYFDIRKFDKPLRNNDKEDDKSLVALFKLLSPEHLLKLSFANDSNTLDKNFYAELLHIIGLTEIKDGGKKIITRHEPKNRNSGSLLENAIAQIDSLDKVSRLKNASQYGHSNDEKLFNIALELSITWVNRILFLKLLEAQLISYHKGNKSYAFLNADLINDYDNLNSLFFQVLAKTTTDRNASVATIFAKVPYLNSSLFEPTDLEHNTLFISQLEDNRTLPLLAATVIKDATGKKNIGNKNALHYFFSFLDAYDFASEGSEDIQEDNKTLINASVLGLIFEKINGYKDGSFFTPSFITMYMCRETIRRAVVQKFNETNNWTCTTFDDLKNQNFTIATANKIINSLKICDPAVGSGHFLVSALNEIIAIKSDLQVLADKNNIRLKNYNLEIVNDELMVTDEDGKPYLYNPNNQESQRIQETLFHEKQTIIENCLFGVDINPNSVKICRLRLWIELLKNAYYKSSPIALTAKGETSNLHRGAAALAPPGTRALETLPNIDINIKCGNSLISRFGLDADLKKALQQSKWTIDTYKLAVTTYQNAQSKEQKREMEALIEEIKTNFKTEIATNDPKKTRVEKLKGELFNYTNQVGLFERSKKEQVEWNKRVNVLANDIKMLDQEIEDIKSNKIYDNAFEWRFEFPSVLDDNGDFIGFDVVIGNPPYLIVSNNLADKSIFNFYSNYKTAKFKINLYSLFQEKSLDIMATKGISSLIIPDGSISLDAFSTLRTLVLNKSDLFHLAHFKNEVFEDATIGALAILFCDKRKLDCKTKYIEFDNELNILNKKDIAKSLLQHNSWSSIINNDFMNITLFEKLEKITKITTFCNIYDGINPGSDEIKKHFINKVYEGYYSHKVIDGRDFSSYSDIEWKDLYVHYSIEKVNLFKENYKLLKKDFTARIIKNINYFEEFKIITRQTSSTLIATIDNNKYYTKNSIHSTVIKKEYVNKLMLEFLLGLINSKLLRWYYNYISSESGRVFPQVKIFKLESLPIILTKVESQQPFIDIVSEILTLKKVDPKTDTSLQEQAIDKMVYELYGLTHDEIKIVEGN